MTSSIWEAGVQGPPGPPGSPALLRLFSNWLQWSIQGTDVWTNLVPLSSITGPAGPSTVGPIGPPGPQGESIQGPQGEPGVAGATILSGTGVPSDLLGANGDYYLDNSSAFLYGPKASGVWPGAPLDLRGGASGVHYGQRAVTNNSSLIAKTAAVDPTLASNSDYTQVTGIFNTLPDGINRGVVQGVNSLTIDRSGAYEVGLWTSLSASLNNTSIAFRFAVNGVISLGRRPIVRLDVANNIGAVSANGFVNLNTGDVVTLWMASTTTCNVKINDAVFSVNELR